MMREAAVELEGFSGSAPLFPLPSVALLPHVVQPLHVFEERYRELTTHALAGERLIAMAVLQPGWETRYDRKDVPIYPLVCLSRIELDQRLPDGRYLLLLRGLQRARILQELSTARPYREAHLELLADVYSRQPGVSRARRRRELLEQFFRLHAAGPEIPSLPEIVERELSLGALCDVLAFASGLTTEELLTILNELRVDVRSELVLGHLRRRARECCRTREPGFPPLFSRN